MFIGNQETEIKFARMPGRSDSKPRPARSLLKNAAKLAGGAAVLGAGIKNKGAIAGGLKSAGGFAKKKASQGVGAAGIGAMKAGSSAQKGIKKIKTGVVGAKNKLGTAVAKRRGLMT